LTEGGWKDERGSGMVPAGRIAGKETIARNRRDLRRIQG